MRKLQLNEIAAYLAYDVQMLALNIEPSPLVSIVTGMCGLLIDDSDNIEYFDLKNVKPILRPLSALFNDRLNPIPLNELKSIYGWDYLFYDVYKKKETFNVNAVKWGCLAKLFEWHFDVFGLLDAGLAIDINTISHA